MIDLTEKFFNEIITSRKYTIRSFKDNPLETKKFSGKCAVVSKRGKEKARELKKFIADTGFSPVVLEFEEARKLKGRVEKKLKNLNILIMHKKDTPVHLFAGDEIKKYQGFLGENGILVHTKYSNKSMLPRQVLSILFNYILYSEEYDYLLQDKKSNTLTNEFIYDARDIINNSEYQDLLITNSINPDYVHITPRNPNSKSNNIEYGLEVISLKEFQKSRFVNSQQDLQSEDIIQFTIVSNQHFDESTISQLEQDINNIYKEYDAGKFKSKVQIIPDS